MKEEIVDFYLNGENDYPFNIQMLGISYCDGSYRIERKNADVYVFEFIIEGEGTIHIDQEKFTPVKGDVYMLPQGKDHLYYSDAKKPWTKIWFNVYGTLVDHLVQAYNLTHVYHIRNLDLKDLFDQMLEFTRDEALTTKELFDKEALIFHKILIRIADRIHSSKAEQITPARLLKQYIEQNAEKNLNMDDLSKVIYKSSSQTIRLFKKEYNITPYEYLLTRKIEIAKLLLSNTNLQVKEIAYRLQFADEHYFSNYFKQKTGLSPLSYRNKGISNFKN